MSVISAILANLLTSTDPGVWQPFGGIGSSPGAFANYQTSSGEVINERSALLVATHFSCIRCKSEDIAKLPCVIAETVDDDNREIRKDDPAYRILNVEYNPEMSAMVGAQTLLAHAIGFKKGIAEIERLGDGTPVALWPLDPTRVTKRRINGKIFHEYRDEKGEGHLIPDADAFEIIGPSYDGLIGYSMAEITKYVLGMAMGAQKFSGSFFGNGAVLGGVIDELPGPMSPEQIETLRKSFNERHQGAGKAFGVAIIPRGKYKEVGIDPKQAELPALLKCTRTDICAAHRVPPHKVQDRSEAHYNSIEHAEIEYVSDALMPLGHEYELQVMRKLLTGERYARINYDALLRADFRTRQEGFAVGRMWGTLSANDVRRKEDMNVINEPWADEYLIPANMIRAQDAGMDRNQTQTNSEDPKSKPDQSALREAYLPLVIEGIDRATLKESKWVSRLRSKNKAADINAVYAQDGEQKLYLISCVVPALHSMAGLLGGLAANQERIGIVTELFASEYVNARPAANGAPSREWTESLAKRWIDATLAALTEE